MARKKKPTDEQSFIAEVRKFYDRSLAKYSIQRRAFSYDQKMVHLKGFQWDEDTLKNRKHRPNLEFNRLLPAVNQVIGDHRQASPQIKVRGVDGDSDKDVAEIYTGLIRNIEDSSDAQIAYNLAFKDAVSGGFGYWRVLPRFPTNGATFDQEICIQFIANSLTVFPDSSSQHPSLRDQNECLIVERMSKDMHKNLFGEEKAKKAADFQTAGDHSDWFQEDEIRVAEYWKRVPVTKEIALLTDGSVVELDKKMITVLAEAENVEGGVTIAKNEDGTDKTRTAKMFEIKWWKLDGAQILEGPQTYNWQFIPIVRSCGRTVNIEGRPHYQSLVRHADDAQKSYNFHRSTAMEVIGNTSRAQWMATAAMIEGVEDIWARVNAENFPVITFKVDPLAPDKEPRRIAGADVPAGLAALIAMDDNDIKASTGMFDASLGERGPQESGEAIRARQQEGDTGSFEFMDNHAAALRFTGEILVDMIPTVYDGERVVRILGEDGVETFEKINAYNEQRDKKIEFGKGNFDVTVTVGPAFATQKRERLRTLIELSGALPLLAEIAPDKILENLDVRGQDEIVKRVRRVLIERGVVVPNDEEKAEIEEQLAQQPEEQPDPALMALVEGEQAKAQLNQAKAQKTAIEAQQLMAGLTVGQQMDVVKLIGEKLANRYTTNEVMILEAGGAQGKVQTNIRVDD